MRFNKRIAIITTIIILVGFFSALLTTTWGMRLTYQLVQPLIPGKLIIKNLQGRLIGPLYAQRVDYQDKHVKILVKNAQLNWHPAALLTGSLHTYNAQADMLSLKVLAQLPSTDESNNSPTIFPLKFIADQLTVKKFLLKIHENTPLVFVNLDLQGKTDYNTVYIKKLQGHYAQQPLTMSGKLQILPMTAHLKLITQLQNKPIAMDINATHLFSNHPWAIKIYLQSSQHRLAGKISAHGDHQIFQADGLVVIKKQRYLPATKLAFMIRGKQKNQRWQFRATSHWKNIHWPLSLARKYPVAISSNSGKFSLRGNTQHYKIQLTSSLTGKNIPPSQLLMKGIGNAQKINLKTIRIIMLAGLITGNASIAWSPQLTWHSQLIGQHINPAIKWQAWPGNISFNVLSQGARIKQTFNGQLQINSLQGKLRQQEICGKANLRYTDGELKNSMANFHFGDAHLVANDRGNKHHEINWHINIPDLSKIFPRSNGRIISQGLIKYPQIKLALQASNARWEKQRIDTLNIQGLVYVDGNHPSRLTFTGKNILINNHHINSIRLKLGGQKKQQHLQATLTMPQAKLQFKISGHYIKHLWHGQINNLTLQSITLGNWQLKKSVLLQLSEKQFVLSPLCWLSRQQGICLSTNWQAKSGWRSHVKLTHIKLQPITKLFFKQFSLTSLLNFNGEFNLSTTQPLSAKINGELLRGKFIYQQGMMQDTLPITSGKFIGTVDQKGLQSSLKIHADKNNFVNAQFSLPGYTHLQPLVQQQKIQGNLTSHFSKLSWLTLLSPNVKNITGNSQIDLQWLGTIHTPKLSGNITIKHAAFNIKNSGLHLRKVNLTATADKKQIFYSAQMQSGKGLLHITGYTWLNKQNFPSQLKVTGKNIIVANSSDMKITASPDLTLKINRDSLYVDGRVTVPTAVIYIRDYASTVTLPSNTVFINQEIVTQKTSHKLLDKLYAKITLILGDDVNFRTNNFSSKLAGSITLNEQPDSITTGNGELRIINGAYKIYGQQLIVNNGKLLFVDSPVTNPALSIRAQKQITAVITDKFDSASIDKKSQQPQGIPQQQTITVGVEITGTLNSPKVKLFSLPMQLSQTDILSYLVLGVSQNRAGASGSQALWQAANTLKGVGTITKGVKNIFSLDQLSVESSSYVDQSAKSIKDGTSGVKHNTSVVLGKMLSPKLFIGYSIGLIEPINTIHVRYKISKNWQLRSKSNSLGNGIDLFYTFETG
ncbi:MAG: translocation/assembly module TamB domain-containing protein [Gammaproteobacteria bacterium]|nr:translocation/assembly module TamB domain-containing protein [Gammaproteobacteria bacterium]